MRNRRIAPIGSNPLEVGIADTGQSPTLFESVGSMPALESTSAPDFVYPPGDFIPGSESGGSIQWFVPNNTLMMPIQ